MDTITTAAAHLVAQRADGFIVISKARRLFPVKPPYEYQHDVDYFPTLGEAIEFFRALESGEIGEGRWQPTAIVPCVKGMPIGSSPLKTFDMAQLVKECGA